MAKCVNVLEPGCLELRLLVLWGSFEFDARVVVVRIGLACECVGPAGARLAEDKSVVWIRTYDEPPTSHTTLHMFLFMKKLNFRRVIRSF